MYKPRKPKRRLWQVTYRMRSGGHSLPIFFEQHDQALADRTVAEYAALHGESNVRITNVPISGTDRRNEHRDHSVPWWRVPLPKDMLFLPY